MAIAPIVWRRLRRGGGATALVAISSETRWWPQRPAPQEQTYRYKGAERAKRHLRPTASAPQSVAAVAAPLPAWQWYRRTVSEGTKGPIAYDFTRHRVPLCKVGLPERTVWLVIKRTRSPEPTYAYAISNAPASTPFRTLIWLSGIRWAVEQCFEEGKTELGMAHSEVRKYAGWQHQMLLTMLAHFFLWHLKGRLGKKAPALTVSQLRRLFEVVLPLQAYTIEESLAFVAWVQRRNHQAYLAHRKRRETEG